MSENFNIDGLVKQRQELESLMMSNPDMEKRVQKLIRKVLQGARRTVGDAAKGKMDADPRHAYKAVKTAVYRRILGGNVSLLSKRRASSSRSSYEPPRQPSARGGNRRPRGKRTQQLMSYEGSDRGFILRFLNGGTGGRTIKFKADPHRSQINRGSRGGDVNKYGKTANTGNRGRIAPRNFFATSSQRAMESAAAELGKLIDELIKSELK